MKLVTCNIYGSMVITNIGNKSSITTTKVEHIIETKKNGIQLKHDLKTTALLLSNGGNRIASWDKTGGWIYG